METVRKYVATDFRRYWLEIRNGLLIVAAVGLSTALCGGCDTGPVPPHPEVQVDWKKLQGRLSVCGLTTIEGVQCMVCDYANPQVTCDWEASRLLKRGTLSRADPVCDGVCINPDLCSCTCKVGREQP